MISDAVQKIINQLTTLYRTNGYVTENEVFGLASSGNLSIFDINDITEHLLSHGVVISEEKEKITTKKGRGYKRNYSKFFKDIAKEYKGLKNFINYYNSVDSLAEGEWVTLIQQARYGNDWARNRLFDTSMKKVIKQAYTIAKKFDVNFEDTLQEASIGIMYAIDAFDETENSSFPSYVPLTVNSRIMRKIYLSYNPIISFPSHLMNDFLKIYSLLKKHSCNQCAYSNNKLTCKNLRIEIQKKLETTEAEVAEYLQYLQPVMNIQEDTSITETDLSDFINDKEMSKYVGSLIRPLKPKEEIVIRMRFGVGTERDHTLEEIGKKYHLTRERIRQIEKKALCKIAWHVYRDHIAKDFL